MTSTSTYKITSTRQVNEILYTVVDYNFDGELVTVEIAHFAPQSVADIELGIVNRASTELERLQYIKSIEQIANTIEIDIEKPI